MCAQVATLWAAVEPTIEDTRARFADVSAWLLSERHSRQRSLSASLPAALRGQLTFAWESVTGLASDLATEGSTVLDRAAKSVPEPALTLLDAVSTAAQQTAQHLQDAQSRLAEWSDAHLPHLSHAVRFLFCCYLLCCCLLFWHPLTEVSGTCRTSA